MPFGDKNFGRINENIKKMIDGGAEKAEIDDYLSSVEAVSPQEVMNFNSAQAQPQQPAPQGLSAGEWAAGLGAKAAQGATFGLADVLAGVANIPLSELSDLATSIITGERVKRPTSEWEDIKKRYREGRQQFLKSAGALEEKYPKTAFLTELAGGVTMPLGAVGKAKTFLGGVGKMAGAGALGGGAYGTGRNVGALIEGEKPAGQVAREAITSAALGGIGGAGLGAVGQTAKMMIPKVGAGVERLAEKLGKERLAQSAKEGEPLLLQGERTITDIAQQAKLKSPAARDIIIEKATKDLELQPQKLSERLNKVFGEKTPLQNLDEIQVTYQKKAQPLWDKAMEHGDLLKIGEPKFIVKPVNIEEDFRIRFNDHLNKYQLSIYDPEVRQYLPKGHKLKEEYSNLKFDTLEEAQKKAKSIAKKIDLEKKMLYENDDTILQRNRLVKYLNKKEKNKQIQESSEQTYARLYAEDLANEMPNTINSKMTKNGTLYVETDNHMVRISDHEQPDWFNEPMGVIEGEVYKPKIDVIVDSLETLEDYNNAITKAEKIMKEGSSKLKFLTQDPFIQDYVSKARNSALGRGLKDLPDTDIRVLQATKEFIDDDISKLRNAGENKQAAALLKTKKELIDNIDNAVASIEGLPKEKSSYYLARKTSAEKYALEEAQKTAENIFTQKNRPEDIKRIVDDFSNAEKDAFLIKVKDELLSKIEQAAKTGRRNVAEAVFGTSDEFQTRKQLEAILGRTGFDDLMKVVNKEARKGREITSLLGGSQTAEKATMAMQGIPTTPENIVTRILGAVQRKTIGRTEEKTQQEIARAITDPAYLASILERQEKPILRSPLAEALLRALQKGQGRMVGQTAAKITEE